MRGSARAGALALALLAWPAAAQPAAAAQPDRLALPFSPACISSPFGARENAGPRASNFHRGIDLPAAAGTWVRAMAAGRITAIRRIGATGLAVDVTHADGSVFRYAHLGQVAPALAQGKRQVAQGDPLGRVGRTGITYGTHLHLEVLVNGERIDPAPLLNLPRCVR